MLLKSNKPSSVKAHRIISSHSGWICDGDKDNLSNPFNSSVGTIRERKYDKGFVDVDEWISDD